MNLDLEKLRTGVLGLTPEFGSFCLQACTVCLEDSNHVDGVNANLLGANTGLLTLNWSSAVNSQIRRNWADSQEATEYGATAIAILLTEKLTQYSCIERSSKGTGFDYWVGDETPLGIFQRKARLEISGILSESKTNNLEQRKKEKEMQTKKSSSMSIDAHVCVMEFSNPKCSYTTVK